VKYAEARPQIRSGDLLAWSHRGWGSWYDIQIQMVRVFTQSEYSHVGIAWVVAGRVFVLEAVQTGVRIFPLSRLLPFYWLPLGANWDAEWESEVEAWALQQVGEPYSKWQAVLAGLGLLRAGEDNIWQCAEYAQEVARRQGTPLVGKATPADLVLAAMMRRGGRQEFIQEV
jgi:hypothetical protein